MGQADLRGRVALVAGGTGDVGEGIVRAFLSAGAAAVVPSRSEEKLQQLRQHLREDGFLQGEAAERFVPLTGHIGTEEGAATLRDAALERTGQLDAVVASLSGPWQTGPLLEVEAKTWRQVLESNLTAHFIAAQTFLPVLAEQEGASYTFISGGAGEQPWPGNAPVSVASAGQLMLVRALAAEQEGEQPRINALVVYTPVIARSRSEGREGWLTADEVGAYACYLASDAAAGLHGELIRFKRREQLAELPRAAE